MKRLKAFSYIIMATSLLCFGLWLCASFFDICHLCPGDMLEQTARTGVERTLKNPNKNPPANREDEIDGFVGAIEALSPRSESTTSTPTIIPTIRRFQIGKLIECVDLQKLFDGFVKLCETDRLGSFDNDQSRAPFSAPKAPAALIHWHDDYTRAVRDAEQQGKMLLVYFCDPGGKCDCNRFKSETLDNPLVCSKLQDYVCLQIPLDAWIIVEGEKTVLLEHQAFKEMLGKAGIALIDYRPGNPQLNGTVVSTFPITQRLWYTPEKMAVILDLPPGTLTQRTLIYAVRTHPDKPASADGELSSYLLEEARKQSQYQADIRLQGHHFWESRFHRISAQLNGLSAREVCAESWPGENLVEAAIECVRCWRLSEGHWSAVRAAQRVFGYDMKRGSNGIWYATGIFGGR